VNVAAIRSTGMTAALGIAERVRELVAALGIEMTAEEPLAPAPGPVAGEPWWRVAAKRAAA
jgi:glycerol-3-phosphate dehydrogenase